MSLWDRILDTINIGGASSSSDNYITSLRRDADSYAFVDVEVGVKNHKIQDIGALRHDGATFHRNSKADLLNFLSDIDFLCGHNIVHHDAKFLFGENIQRWALVDTLYMSPLLFPERPYHRLVKDDKLMSDEMNNPVNDCEKARSLLFDEIPVGAVCQNAGSAFMLLCLRTLRSLMVLCRWLELRQAQIIRLQS